MKKQEGCILNAILFLLSWDSTLSFHISQHAMFCPSSLSRRFSLSGMPCGDGKNCSQHPAQNSISRHKVEERNKTNAFNLDRNAFFLQFFSRISSVAAITTSFPQLSEAIEFVPASPSYNGTYQDAMEILSSQRLAVDNISDVISNGNLDEAGFKAMQLSAQIRTA